MIKEIFQQLITDIKEGIEGLDVDEYRGEFHDEQENWTPTDTACRLRVLGMKPIARSADGKVMRYNTVIQIYAGAIGKRDKSALDVAESLMELLDGGTLAVTIGAVTQKFTMTTSDDGWEFLVYKKTFYAYSFLLIVT